MLRRLRGPSRSATFRGLLLSVLVPTGAALSAELVTVDGASRPNTVQLELGVASAVGELGLTYSRHVLDHLELEAGVGLGSSGVQLSAMPRLSFGSARNRFVCGVGLSVGVPGMKRAPSNFAPAGGDEIVVPWLNADLAGYEHRAESGFVFSISAGTTTSLTSGLVEGPYYPESDAIDLRGFTVLQMRVGVGFAF